MTRWLSSEALHPVVGADPAGHSKPFGPHGRSTRSFDITRKESIMKTKFIAIPLLLCFLVSISYGNTSTRFEVCEDGTVKDHKTGLMWLENPKRIAEMSWNSAKAVCDHLETGGYKDWRLPCTQELHALCDQNDNESGFPVEYPFKVHTSKSWNSNRAVYWCGETWGRQHAAVASPFDDWSFNSRHKEKSRGYVWPVRGSNKFVEPVK